MNQLLKLIPLLLLAWTQSIANELQNNAPAKQQMEICFVLDTTASMSGLIEGAKQKIWSIANQLISAKPTPDLKIGLVAYRDRGDEFVVKSFNLTDDIDSIYAELRKLKAEGGEINRSQSTKASKKRSRKCPGVRIRTF